VLVFGPMGSAEDRKRVDEMNWARIGAGIEASKNRENEPRVPFKDRPPLLHAARRPRVR